MRGGRDPQRGASLGYGGGGQAADLPPPGTLRGHGAPAASSPATLQPRNLQPPSPQPPSPQPPPGGAAQVPRARIGAAGGAHRGAPIPVPPSLRAVPIPRGRLAARLR